MVKRPSQQAINRTAVTSEQADELARKLADKPYGSEERQIINEEAEKQKRTTISINESLLLKIEDLALKNKREGKAHKSVSAIAREAFELYLEKYTEE